MNKELIQKLKERINDTYYFQIVPRKVQDANSQARAFMEGAEYMYSLLLDEGSNHKSNDLKRS